MGGTRSQQEEHDVTWVESTWECSCGSSFPEDKEAYQHYADSIERYSSSPIPRSVAAEGRVRTEMELGAEGQLPVEPDYTGA